MPVPRGSRRELGSGPAGVLGCPPGDSSQQYGTATLLTHTQGSRGNSGHPNPPGGGGKGDNLNGAQFGSNRVELLSKKEGGTEIDRESQTHKPQTLSSFYSSSRPATASQRSPSKHGGPSAPGALQPLTSGSAGPAQPGSVAGAGPGPTEGFTEKNVPGEVGALGRGDVWYGAVLGPPFPGSSQCPAFPTQRVPHIPPVRVSHLRQL